MAIEAGELMEWLEALEPTDLVFIDEGGLVIRTPNSDAYLEIGGEPDEERDRG